MGFIRLLVLLAFAFLSAPAGAQDFPVEGKRFSLSSHPNVPEKRRFSFRARDAAIGPAFLNPANGSALIVHASSAAGECRAEIPLDPAKWQALKGDGANRGYRYTDKSGLSQGIRRILLRPGHLSIRGRGAAWPCDLTAPGLSTPVTVELRVHTRRYCASFGGDVRRNQAGKFRAVNAPAPADCLDSDLTVANLNLLHGLGCASDQCRLPDRVDLFYDWVVDSGCPDVLTLQEIIDLPGLISGRELVEFQGFLACPFAYESVFISNSGIDEQMILSRYPVLLSELLVLYKGFRTVTYARIDHPVGPVDVFSTHLASGSDGGSNPCAGDCPAECIAAGVANIRDCQAVQTAQFVEARHDVDAPAIVTGDFNQEPGSFTYNQFADRGWSDVYLAALANPECDPITGVGCTTGRDASLAELESTDANVDRRIDFIFAVPPGPGSACSVFVDPPLDLDGDGSVTKTFADEPNPFETCGPAPDAVCWASDHEGVELDLNCRGLL